MSTTALVIINASNAQSYQLSFLWKGPASINSARFGHGTCQLGYSSSACPKLNSIRLLRPARMRRLVLPSPVWASCCSEGNCVSSPAAKSTRTHKHFYTCTMQTCRATAAATTLLAELRLPPHQQLASGTIPHLCCHGPMCQGGDGPKLKSLSDFSGLCAGVVG